MATEDNPQDERYPWLSWATTGVLTLAGVLIFGLVESAQRPRPQASLPAPVRKDATAKPSVSGARAAIVDFRSAKESPLSRSERRVSLPPAAVPQLASPAIAKPTPTPAPVAKVDPPQPAAPPAATAPPDAAKHAAYIKAVAEVRRLMAARDISASKKRLKSAAANAQSPAEKAEIERLDMIQDHLEQFWDGIRRTVAAMQPTEEIILSESDRVAVIESSRTELAVQMYGRQQRYRIEALPMDLLSAIAKETFKLTPGTKLVIGSFLAVDAHGNRAEARKYWREAIAAGENDGKLLMPELEVPQPNAK